MNVFDIKIDGEVNLVGDILIKVFNLSKSALGFATSTKAFRFAFNTAFLENRIKEDDVSNEKKNIKM